MVNIYSELVKGWRGSQQPFLFSFSFMWKIRKSNKDFCNSDQNKENDDPSDNDNLRDWNNILVAN